MLSFILANIPFALGSVDSKVVEAGITIIILQTRKWKFRRYFQSHLVRKNRAKDLGPMSVMVKALLFEMEHIHLLHEPLKSPPLCVRTHTASSQGSVSGTINYKVTCLLSSKDSVTYILFTSSSFLFSMKCQASLGIYNHKISYSECPLTPLAPWYRRPTHSV